MWHTRENSARSRDRAGRGLFAGANSVLGVALIALTTLAIPTAAQQRGTVTGKIIQGSTLRPLSGAQVIVVETNTGTLANAEGVYTLANLPAGPVTLQVRMIGYGMAERVATVTAGETTVVDFALETQALALDEIVVTGTAGGQQRRSIGNVVSSMNVELATEKVAPPSMQQMLMGQIPGMTVSAGAGNVGTGGNIVIRGLGTMALASAPLLYVDGVRASASMNNIDAGAGVSRLNDINPEDIERIEVIKGPAAATLYGTEASNGVIQIITKKGRSGAPTIDMMIRRGANWFNDPEGRIPVNYGLENGEIISQHLYLDERAAGRSMFRTGDVQSMSLSVRGGQEQLSYYLSGNHEDEEGFLNNNGLLRTTLRTNLRIGLSDKTSVNADVGVVRSDIQIAPDGTSGTIGLIPMILWGTPGTRNTPSRGFMVGPPEYQDMLDFREELNRATGSVTATHTPFTWLTHRVILGFDFADATRSTFYPRLPEGTPAFYGANSTGRKQVVADRELNQTFDYNATATFDVTPDLNSSTSVGVQYFMRENSSGTATGTQLPTPAVSTVSSASVRTGAETFVENKTFGVFVQETVGWRNQAFLTAALRADANSAFGESFDAAYYPKVSGTWVVSEAPFWNLGLVNNLRLRAAWGKSGLQPDAFAAIRTWAPMTGPNDRPAVTPGNVGNPDLKPEVGQELELGFDASLFDDRLSLEITHYRQHTKDAILEETIAPSTGFAGTRYVNAGEVSNRGWEFKVDALPIQTQLFSLNLTATLAHNKNRLEDLGGRPAIQADTRGRWQHREGYPLGGHWTKYIATAEWGGPDGRTLVNITCKGPAEEDYRPMPCSEAPFHYWGDPGPTWTGSFTNNISIGSRLSLNALWVWVGDSRRFNTTEWYRDKTQSNSLRAVQMRLGTLDPIVAAGIQEIDIEHTWFERDDFIRLRDVTLSYNVPSAWLGGLASRASISVSGRNLWTPWVHPSFRPSGLDPEVKRQRSVNWGWQQTQAPMPHSIVTTVRLTF